MNELLDILKEAMPKVDWENGEDLVDDGVIDSMDVVTIFRSSSQRSPMRMISRFHPKKWNRKTSIPQRQSMK